MGLDDLAKLGAKQVKRTGEGPSKVARELLKGAHGLSRTEMRRLAEVGLSTHIQAVLSEWRHSSEQASKKRDRFHADTVSDPGYGEVKRLHEELDCPYVSHGQHAMKAHAKRRFCVDSYLEDPEGFMERRNRAAGEESEAMREMFEGISETVEMYFEERLKEIILIGYDGEMRALYDFTIKDIDSWSAKSQTNLETWTVRVDWFADARAAFEDNPEAKAVHDLPLETQYELCQGADKVWADDAA